MTDAPLHPDHQRILELARAALKARDNRQLWRQNVLKACEEHTHWCNALWEELERQCCDQHDTLNVLEHPSVKQRKMIANLRSEIVNAAMVGIEQALEELSRGPMMEDHDHD
jgi:LmbE family N-acetylglucosaminyl deacetylase